MGKFYSDTLHHTVEEWAVTLPKQSPQDSRMNTGQVAVATVLERMIGALVDQPEAVSIEAVEDEASILFRVNVAPADRGKIIGGEGRIARSLRILLSGFGMKLGTSFGLELLDDPQRWFFDPHRDRD
jgi:predicted RNA-binding protein YlqC (UPF0109 family)